MIYVIRAIGSQYIKIGKAKNPLGRMKTLQTGTPYKLVLASCADWPDSSEKRLHRVLVDLYVIGEWYLLTDKTQSLIDHMQSGLDLRSWLAKQANNKRLERVLRLA